MAIIIVKEKQQENKNGYISFLQLLMGIFRMGYLASFMSDPLISGFTCGAAVHVFSSQVPHLFGVDVMNYHGPFKLLYVSFSYIRHLKHE